AAASRHDAPEGAEADTDQAAAAAPAGEARPQRREGPKVGRNDPCPCGSGKKFKQCCGKLS
ncbi:SEC-C metal-binding domain-containing protein, partial [Halomonas salina]|uniref:SEC-C metal-binding domain-containing protein n=1 Tax=Halomonas salina TaxID=42565 RepID=UPI000551C912